MSPGDIATLRPTKAIVGQEPLDLLPSWPEHESVMSDLRVRQAIQAVDGVLVYGVMTARRRSYLFIPQGLSGYTEGIDPLPICGRRKALLAEAGYENGLEIVMKVPESRSEHAQMIQADLKKIGIDMKIELLESGAFWDDLENGDYQMMMMGWSYVVMDTDVGVYSLYQSEQIVAGNYARLNNARLDELMEAGRVTADAAGRDEIYREAEEIAMTEAAWVPLYWRNTIVAYDKNLQNFEIPPVVFLLRLRLQLGQLICQ